MGVWRCAVPWMDSRVFASGGWFLVGHFMLVFAGRNVFAPIYSAEQNSYDPSRTISTREDRICVRFLRKTHYFASTNQLFKDCKYNAAVFSFWADRFVNHFISSNPNLHVNVILMKALIVKTKCAIFPRKIFMTTRSFMRDNFMLIIQMLLENQMHVCFYI